MSYGPVPQRGLHLFQIANRLTSRLLSVESLLFALSGEEYSLVLATTDADKTVFERLLQEGGVPASKFTLLSTNALSAGQLLPAVQEAIVQVESLSAKHGGIERLGLFIDLSPLLVAIDGGAAATQLVNAIAALQRERSALVVTTATAVSIPKGIGAPFCEVHDQWLAESAVASERGGRSAHVLARLALEEPAARLHYLDQIRAAGTDPEFPRLPDSYRRGFLVLDRELTIRYVSQQLANLLGRNSDELIDRPLSTCLDGVDLTTVRREVDLVARGGTSTPFITAWRLKAGRYGPREVSVDVLEHGNRRIGYLLSVGVSEQVRGPRTIYRDARKDLALSDFVEDEDSEGLDTTVDGLESTQITRREHEVLLLILQDLTNKAIARHLNIAEVTVKKHLTSIYRKLRITSRKELLQSFSAPGDVEGEDT